MTYDNNKACKEYYKRNKEELLRKQKEKYHDDVYGMSARLKNCLIFLWEW